MRERWGCGCVRRGALGPRRVAMRTSLLEELLDAVGAERARHVGLVAHDQVAQPLHFHVEHGGGAARERVTRVAVTDAGRRVPLRRRAGDRRRRLALREGHLATVREGALLGGGRDGGEEAADDLDRFDLLVAEGVPEREYELVELRSREAEVELAQGGVELLEADDAVVVGVEVREHLGTGVMIYVGVNGSGKGDVKGWRRWRWQVRESTSAIDMLVRACSLRYRSESTACSNDANLS